MKYVIALGGSILCPDEINTDYAKQFAELVTEKTKQGDKFIVIVGGGGTSRKYQKAATYLNNISNEQLDNIGLTATKLNAQLLKTAFKGVASENIFDSRGKITSFNDAPVIIGCGWSPGWSTDFVAFQIAVDLEIDEVVILSKPKYVYSGDPEKDENAQPLYKVTWEDYLKIIPEEWTPGLKLPIDPVASKLALKEKKIGYLTNGEKIDNLKNILEKKEFIGTTLY